MMTRFWHWFNRWYYGKRNCLRCGRVIWAIDAYWIGGAHYCDAECAGVNERRNG